MVTKEPGTGSVISNFWWTPSGMQGTSISSSDYDVLGSRLTTMDVTRLEVPRTGLMHSASTADDGEADPDMARMEQAAEQGNETMFLDAYHAVDWSTRPAEDFVRALRLALSAGAHMAARKLAMRGAEHHPEHETLRRYAHVLAPPRVIRNDLPPRPEIGANIEWIKAHAGQFRGQWVALQNGILLGSADSFRELVDRIGETKGILLTKVW